MKKLLAKMLVVVLVLSSCFGTVSTARVEAKESSDYVIKVNVGTNCVTIYKGGKAVKSMICSPSEETPIGTFYTPVKYRWHEMIGNCYAQYCTRITDGILFHSVWYYKNGDKSTMSVSAYNVMGNKASHGCVRLLCKDSKWIYDNCALKTKVVIFRGTKKDDPLGRPSFTPLKTSARTSWDPTDPDKNNPFLKAKPIVKAENKEIEYGTKIKDLTKIVTIQDSAGNTLTKKNATIKTKGKINTKKLGKYKVTYKVKDKLGHKVTKQITFKVVDTKKPTITGISSNPDVTMGSTQNLLSGIKAKSASGKSLNSKIKITVKNKKTGKKLKVTKGKVKFSQTGKYTVTYKVVGSNKKSVKKTVTYTVIDKRVKMSVTQNISIAQGAKFVPLNYVNYIKDYKGITLDKTKSIKVTGTVNTNVPGTYTVTYAGRDRNDANTEVRITAKVTVVKKLVKPTTPTTQPTTQKPTEQATTKQPETTTKAPETQPTTGEQETTKAQETTTAR